MLYVMPLRVLSWILSNRTNDSMHKHMRYKWKEENIESHFEWHACGKLSKEIISSTKCCSFVLTEGVKSLDLDLNVYPHLASTLQDLSVDTLFASIEQELRKVQFRVTRSEIIGYMIVRWSVSGETFGGKHTPSRWVEHVHHTPWIPTP